MICDFKRANPDITPDQILLSQLLDQLGGIIRIKALFGTFDSLLRLVDEALFLWSGDAHETLEDSDGTNA